MFYDPRISIGMLFTLIGTILTAFGLSTRSSADVYVKSLGIDANLWWGLALLAFGILMLAFGYGISFDIENLQMASFDQDNTPQSRQLLDGFSGSRYFSFDNELRHLVFS